MTTKKGRPKNKRDLKRISTHIPEEHDKLLNEIAAEDDLSKGQIIRRAIELYLISQQEVLSIQEDDITLAKHISETRSKKAQIISHSNRLNQYLDGENIAYNSDNEALKIFEDLNPDAF